MVILNSRHTEVRMIPEGTDLIYLKIILERVPRCNRTLSNALSSIHRFSPPLKYAVPMLHVKSSAVFIAWNINDTDDSCAEVLRRIGKLVDHIYLHSVTLKQCLARQRHRFTQNTPFAL